MSNYSFCDNNWENYLNAANVEENNAENILCNAKKIDLSNIYVNFPSVGYHSNISLFHLKPINI